MATNILQQVQTYQMANLALLQNLNVFISIANTKFKDFDRIEANLGDTVTFDLPPRFSTNSTLVATFQDSAQRAQALTVDQAENVSYEFTAQEFIFNVDDYMDKFGRSAMAELSASVESNVATNCVTHTYRFYGNGVDPIDSYDKLAQALALYRNYGAPKNEVRGILSDIAVPAIVGSGLNQFALDRNNEIAADWMVGRFSNCDWHQSNLLPVHTAGNIGNFATTLTFVSINAAGDQVTFSGATASDPNAIKKDDLLEFAVDNTVDANLNYLTFIGHKASANAVQVRATADAASDGAGNVIVDIYPPLIATAGDKDRNLSRALTTNDTATALPNHRAGVIYGGDALFLGMPRLPKEVPFPTANETDPDTGVSMRMYYGSQFGLNQRGFVNDCIWGSTLVDEYAMRLVFPLTT